MNCPKTLTSVGWLAEFSLESNTVKPWPWKVAFLRKVEEVGVLPATICPCEEARKRQISNSPLASAEGSSFG